MSTSTITPRPQPVVPADIVSLRRDVDPVPTRRRTGRAGNLVVACILDGFSFTSFSGEADFAPLTMGNWLVELTAAQPDLLLVESAWRGHRQKWWNTVHRHGDELTGIVEWCRDRGIPTAFWNKEDPVHFNTFLTTAGMFDAVFTTDLDCVPRYKKELDNSNVHFLPFAAQPAESNPIEVFERTDGCAFAGAYYDKYPERLADLAELSAELAAEGRRFDIYDRNHGSDMPGYMFPPEYESHIVGGALTPDLLDIPYKGYTTNLNLNSVKQSQSMFARRVFELMASNTLVVSNFSRGLRLMFGDLAITTDSGKEMTSRLAAVEREPNGIERLRAMALRKVLREHTYSERLSFIAEKAGVSLPPASGERPALVLAPAEDEKIAQTVAALLRQSWSDLRIYCQKTELSTSDPRVRQYETTLDAFEDAARDGCTHLGFIDPADWHGEHYLEDLVLAHRFADVAAVGHGAGFVQTESGLSSESSATAGPWNMSPSLALSRSLLKVEAWGRLPWDLEAGTAHAGSMGPGLAVGRVEFIENGSDCVESERQSASSLALDEGLPLSDIRAWSQTLKLPEGYSTDIPRLDLATLLTHLPHRPSLSLTTDQDGAIRLTSAFEAGQHDYWIAPAFHQVPDTPDGVPHTFYFDASVGLDVTLVVYYFDELDTRIGHTMIPPRQNVKINYPLDCVRIKWGLRVSGSGTTKLEHLYTAPFTAPALPLIKRADQMVISNVYADYATLYRNAFVHSRLRAYASAGHRSEVLVLSSNDQTDFREFQDVDVTNLSKETLEATIRHRSAETLIVHTLTPGVWDVLISSGFTGRVLIWVHGFEIQPWWRRKFNYTTASDLEEAKSISGERMKFWASVFEQSSLDLHFVFVSDIFAESVFEDLGMRLNPSQYSIIHNPIDTELFAYTPKNASMRKRILSIRPYHSRVYANDLAVQAVLELQERDGFGDIEFAFYGDGPLFDETLEPLKGIPNVEIHRGFLTHQEIASLHRHYGVLLVPSRSDTQGVSRDEAMSSGLVPITNSVAAIPEFVDSASGFLCAEESVSELAEAVWALQGDPDRYIRMSQEATRRVRRQSSRKVIVNQELSLIVRQP